MPRSPRLDYPGARHHVMNRAARHEAMFLDDAICALFLDTVAEVPERFGARVHGYALMPNHYHLMLQVPRGNLSDVMKHIGAVFTQALNRRQHHDGPVFRGRFRNQVVSDDAYWMHLLAYLHLNPVKDHLAKRPEDCLWTSHNAYIDGALRPDWLTCDELLGLFGSATDLGRYIEDVRSKRRGRPDDFDPNRFWSSATAVAPPPAAPEPRSPEQALADVAAVTGVPVGEVLAMPRGRTPNLPAWLAVWWLLRCTGQTQADVGRRLEVSRPRVSQLLTKLHSRARDDASLRQMMSALEAMI